jgi:hypothetical protein
MQYLVKLLGAGNLAMRDRIELETRFVRELERLAGGPDAIRNDLPSGVMARADALAWQGRAKPGDARFCSCRHRRVNFHPRKPPRVSRKQCASALTGIDGPVRQTCARAMSRLASHWEVLDGRGDRRNGAQFGSVVMRSRPAVALACERGLLCDVVRRSRCRRRIRTGTCCR